MEFLKQMEPIVRQAGEILLTATDILGKTHQKSSAADLVTAYDVKVENFLKEKLLALKPDAIFYGEEEKENQDPTRGWAFIVDPIDGTANFVRGLSQSAVSVALLKDGAPEYAMVLDPYRRELYTAKRGHGAFCNGQPIHVSENPMERSIIAMGSAPYNPELRDRTFTLLRRMADRCCDFRRMGAAVPDLCALACGRVDAFFECILSPWDYAAGSLLITEAGGVICTLEGEPLPNDKKCSVWASNAVNAHVREEILD